MITIGHWSLWLLCPKNYVSQSASWIKVVDICDNEASSQSCFIIIVFKKYFLFQYDLNYMTLIPSLTFTDYEWFPWSICNGCCMPAGNAYPSGHLVPSPILGLANAPIVETKFLEFTMSLLDFSPRIPLGTFSILPFISIWKIVPARYRSSTNFRHCMAKFYDFRVSHTDNLRKIIDIKYATCVENQ